MIVPVPCSKSTLLCSVDPNSSTHIPFPSHLSDQQVLSRIRISARFPLQSPSIRAALQMTVTRPKGQILGRASQDCSHNGRYSPKPVLLYVRYGDKLTFNIQTSPTFPNQTGSHGRDVMQDCASWQLLLGSQCPDGGNFTSPPL